MLPALLLVAAAYLAGSLSTAILISRLRGLPDPRRAGSGNPGATNVLRLAGKGAAAWVLAGDLLKGLLPVLLARALGLGEGALAAVGLAAFLGHLYPVYFGFRGGKGVATSLGVLLGWSWPVGLGALAVWLTVAALTRYSSLAALCAAAAAPLLMAAARGPGILTGATALLALWLAWRHRANVRRLLAGTEDRIGERRGREEGDGASQGR
ncbi:MAG: glycerol-3-phosphate 1-O-acyltransferase [Gammaproteobacteria bacterium]|nr:MAG: glycerol-3-phosphate 1-O-acyltransferase [Gammaproteobacteria bacterium]